MVETPAPNGSDDKVYATLNVDQRAAVDRLLQVIAMQADVIDDMSRRLDNEIGADEVRARQITGPAMLSLAARLKDPVVKAPTMAELDSAIDKMNKDIASAKSAQAIFSTVLSFAQKVVPFVP